MWKNASVKSNSHFSGKWKMYIFYAFILKRFLWDHISFCCYNRKTQSINQHELYHARSTFFHTVELIHYPHWGNWAYKSSNTVNSACLVFNFWIFGPVFYSNQSPINFKIFSIDTQPLYCELTRKLINLILTDN